MKLVGLSVTVPVFQHHNAVTFQAKMLLTIIDALGHPNSAFGIYVHIRWVTEKS
jgi:hypothetical protein